MVRLKHTGQTVTLVEKIKSKPPKGVTPTTHYRIEMPNGSRYTVYRSDLEKIA